MKINLIYNSRNYRSILAIPDTVCHLEIYNSRNYRSILAIPDTVCHLEIYNSRNYRSILANRINVHGTESTIVEIIEAY